MQIWVALPKVLEKTEPSFVHIEAHELPEWEQDGITIKLIAGEALGKKSPVPVYSKLYFIELKSIRKQHINLLGELYGESGLYILEGSIETEGNTFLPKQLLVAKDAATCGFTMNENTTVYIFGGEPLPEPRHIYWNFVATSPEFIEEAKERWLKQEFPAIPGETGFVPLPPQNNNFNQKK